MMDIVGSYAVKGGRKLSLQCLYILEEEHELQVLRSGAGYYIGTLDAEGFPNSRDSGYFASAGEAQAALDANSFAPRIYP